jgi:8-oxo-dGTP pyrophosphatase MutT (NUDIX family)
MTTGQDRSAPTNDPQPIFDAGVVVIADTSGPGEPKIFLGRRQPNNVFLPGKWVFPGGRSEAGDGEIVPHDSLNQGDIGALIWAVTPAWTSARATAMALTAVREVFEETGLAIGLPGAMCAGIPSAWTGFAATGMRPAIASLRFIARAITPPDRPRRYDTRFFLAPRHAIGADAEAHDGEFTEQGWYTMSECRALDLPNITRLVLDDASEALKNPLVSGGGVPFYYQAGGTFRRDLIPRGA